MRYSRQDKIIELINKYEIDTQEALAQKLLDSGYKVTQATISRDIRELSLIKVLTTDGRYKYALSQHQKVSGSTDRYEKIFKSTVNSISYAGNIIVLKTLSGCANAACEAFDSIGAEGVVGSLAGDNTAFVVVDLPEHVPEIVEKFNIILSR